MEEVGGVVSPQADKCEAKENEVSEQGSLETSIISLDEIDVRDMEDDEDTTSIEMVSPVSSTGSSFESPSRSTSSQSSSYPEDLKLSGWLKLAGLGFRKAVKAVWFVYGDDTGKLYYYRQRQDLLPLGEIDIRNSSLTYDVSNRDKPGLFEIRSGGRVYSIDAQERVHMLYWLDALQKKRRGFSARQSTLAKDAFFGKKKELDASGLLGRGTSEVGTASCQSPGEQALYSPQEGFDAEVPGKPQYWSLLNLRAELRNAVTSLRAPLSARRGSYTPGNQKPMSTQSCEDWMVIDKAAVPAENCLPTPVSTTRAQGIPTTEWHVPLSPVSGGDNGQQTTATTVQASDGSQQTSLNFSNGHPVAQQENSSSEKQDIVSPTFSNQSKNIPLSSGSSTSPMTSPVLASSPQQGNNGKLKFMNALRSNFKLMKESSKDKTVKLGLGSKQTSSPVASSPIIQSFSSLCVRCKVLGDDLFNVQEDLKAAEEELQANREIVRLLQKELDVMRAEINTREECRGMSETQLLQALKQKDKHVVELDHSRAAILEEKSLLSQELRLSANELKDLKDQISMFQQTLAVKDEMIISLTNQNQEFKNNNQSNPPETSGVPSLPHDLISLEADRKELERLNVTCSAYEVQNTFLTKEILELNALRQDDETREKLLKMNVAKLEAQYYQTRSKYLYLLNEKHIPVRGGDESKSQEAVNQLLQEALESEANQAESDVTRQAFMSSQGKEYDHYGFLKFGHEDEDVLVARANDLQRQSEEINYMIRDVDEVTSKRIKWENFMVGQSPGKPLQRSADLKLLIRLGIPHEFRERIWKGCIDLYVSTARLKLGDKYYKDLEERANSSKSNPATKQVELDLLRTLPENRFFEKMDSPGVQKLRRVLLCYSMHNPLIGYCQGLNRIAAIALLFLCEEDAFWCMVAIIDHLMPPNYYTTTLAAAQADQRVLKDLVQDKCPKLHAHLELHEIDLSLFTFNWFLTVFVDGIHPELFLQIWDVFLYEGSKVLFRFALAFLKYTEEAILKQPSNLAINRYMRTLGNNITDVKKIISIAFSELNPFPMRSISSKRQYHMAQVKAELDELETMRKDFKMAHVQQDEDRERKANADREDYSDDELDDCKEIT